MIDDSERRYTDREVRLILKSAADLQQRVGDDAAGSRGMSLAELEQVASEAGIDSALIRRAAADLDVPATPGAHNSFLGAPTEIVIERTVDAAIGAEVFDSLLEVVRATTHEVGFVSTVGKQFGWKGRMRGAKTDVSISAGETRTTLRVRVALDEAAVGHFMLRLALFGLGGGLIGTALLAPVVGLLAPVVGLSVAGTGYAWARRGLAGTTEEHRRSAIDLVDALAARAMEASGPRRSG
jgi:hypothetical protein